MSDTGASLRRSLPPLYAAAALRLLQPLVVLPLVASRVGPAEFGRLGFVVVWAGLLSTLVEGGFLAAATRLAVQADAPRRWSIAQQIFTTRVAACPLVLLLSVLAVAWAGEGARPADALAIAALAWALGWPATWHLQATQQLAAWSRVEIAVHALLLLACWAFARSVTVYLGLQIAAFGTLAALGWHRVWGDLVPPQGGRSLWQPASLAAGLRLGWTMLPVSLAGAAYSMALPAAASARMPKTELGLYFMADRIVRSALSAADPLYALVYPRIVGLFGRGADGARAALRHAARWALGGAALGAVMLVLGELAWPALSRWLAPRAGGFDLPALHRVLQVLAWLLPLLLGWKFLGYWMLGSGRYDRAYRACVVVGGVVGVASALSIGGSAGALGLAWTALGVELVVIGVALAGIGLARRGRAAAP